jgi:hypothetical protein
VPLQLPILVWCDGDGGEAGRFGEDAEGVAEGLEKGGDWSGSD